MNKKTLLTCIATFLTLGSFAQYRPLEDLHVEGRDLVNAKGKKVVLHGVMDTPSTYFNSNRWTNNWSYNDAAIPNCLKYFDEIYSMITNVNQGAYCDVFRLHMDPCWTNEPGKPCAGEHDISAFSESRYRNFLDKLYIELVKKAHAHQLWVVVRPPGVCPGTIKAGDDYQRYLIKVWSIFAQNEYVQSHPGTVSIELANEPINVLDSAGMNSPKALKQFFQPVVDAIRATGFKGIVWVPGATWQQSYSDYATYPCVDKMNNMGYAVHDYPGWYGSSDDNPNYDGIIESFKNSIPVVETNPIIITEVDWSPSVSNFNENDPSTYKVVENGKKIPLNLGTWATGSTDKWGKSYRKILDTFGNVSMTLTSTDDYVDYNYYHNTGRIRAAFYGKDGYQNACGAACLAWYKEFAEANQKSLNSPDEPAENLIVDRLTPSLNELTLTPGNSQRVNITATAPNGYQRDVTSKAVVTMSDDFIAYYNGYRIVAKTPGDCKVTYTITENGKEYSTDVLLHVPTYFPLTNAGFNKDIWNPNKKASYNENTQTLKTEEWGFGGWTYQNGIDLSMYKYLFVNLKEPYIHSWNFDFRLFDQSSYFGGHDYELSFNGQKVLKIDLHNMTGTAKNQNGSTTTYKVDPSHIYIAGFWSDGQGDIKIDGLYLSKDGTNGIAKLDADGIHEIASIAYYSLSGQKVNESYPGIKVKKITFTDGKTESFKVK